MYKLYKNNQEIKTASNLTWETTVNTVGSTMSFDVAVNTTYMPNYNIAVGDIIKLYNNGLITENIVIAQSYNDKNTITYTTVDFGWYLNKSKKVYQFKTNATDCIKKICGDYGITVVMPSLNTYIKKIYIDSNLIDIIKDILLQVEQEKGTKYYTEMRENKLYIYAQYSIVINAKFRLSSNTNELNSNSVLIAPKRTLSIEDLRNKITIVTEKDEAIRTIAETSDSASQNKYGILQEVIKTEEKDIAQARNIARNTLEQLNKITEKTSVTLFGDDTLRAGRVIKLTEEYTKINGYYEIISCKNRLENGHLLCDLELEAVK